MSADHCEACPFASCQGCRYQTPECIIDGCAKPSATAQMCQMHYSRKIRHGDPNHDRRATTMKAAVDRFWIRVNKTPSCWLWNGPLGHNGYGYFRVKGLPGAGAHRFAWRITRGEIPEGMQIDHLCRVRHCVNPDHMQVVTPQENTLRSDSVSADNARKPRCPKCGGEYSIAKRGALKPGRYCQPCHSERRRQRKAERRAARVVGPNEGDETL